MSKGSAMRRTAYTVIGVLILCVMLFPVYWMLNASLQPSGNTLTAGFLPLHPTFSGYKRALDEQGGNLVTSMIIAAGTVVLCLAIVLPISKNSLITAGLFSFLFSWSDFLFALTLTTKGGVRPVTLGIYQYLGTQVQNWNAVMATAVLSAVPAIVLLVAAQKYI